MYILDKYPSASCTDLNEGARGIRDAAGDLGVVHRVEMDAVDTMGGKIDDLVDRVSDAGIAERLGVILEPREHGRELAGQGSAAEPDHPPDLLGIDHRHDPRLDRDGDPGDVTALEKSIEERVIEEELRDQVLGTGIDLLTQMADVRSGRRGLGVCLRVAGGEDVESPVPPMSLCVGSALFIRMCAASAAVLRQASMRRVRTSR